MSGRTVIQWGKEDCADLGLIKVDLLGLGMMAALKETIELIPRHYNTSVDLAALPEDLLVYETLRKADTVGMFQVESRADGLDSAQRTDALLRSRGAGVHH